MLPYLNDSHCHGPYAVEANCDVGGNRATNHAAARDEDEPSRDRDGHSPHDDYHGYRERSRDEFGLQMDSTEALFGSPRGRRIPASL